MAPAPVLQKDFVNPNAATDQQVFSSPQGLAGGPVGLQRCIQPRASSLYNRVTINGLVTKELTVLNQGNTGEYQLQLGSGSVDGTNNLASGLWTSSNKIITIADKVIAGAQGLSDKGYASGLIGYAPVQALALADLSMFWEKFECGFQREFLLTGQGYAKAMTTVDDALAAINANAFHRLHRQCARGNQPRQYPAWTPSKVVIVFGQLYKRTLRSQPGQPDGQVHVQLHHREPKPDFRNPYLHNNVRSDRQYDPGSACGLQPMPVMVASHFHDHIL